MAGDAINLCGITMQDMKQTIPEPSDLPFAQDGEIVTFALADFDAYRKLQDTRAVRKTVSIPAWMDEMAAERKISLSRVLQDALSVQLGAK